jgi:hypothetical protein
VATTSPRSKIAAEGTAPAGAGAAIHPTFLRIGPRALSFVVAVLFCMSFTTSYAALCDYAYELEFSASFAVAFPLVLDAVIVVLRSLSSSSDRSARGGWHWPAERSP